MRSMWKGSISFGLVNIPVKMYTATEDRDVKFNQLHEVCHTPIKYSKVCQKCQREVSPDEIVRGYEFAKGQYVVIDDEEWTAFQGKSNRAVEILRFVELAEIDPIFFNKTYYLEPADTGTKAYQLLKEAMSQSAKIGIATITIRTKSALAAVRVFGNVLALETMFYPDEIRSKDQLQIPMAELQTKELEMAISLIDNLTEPFQPEQYQDIRRADMLHLIEGKITGKETITPEIIRDRAEVADLMAALEASLKAQQKRELEKV